ncbi:LysR family transcriptional regulator [Vibrio nitrifigilis]|uniref:LysR family transcriptional regulator n=1 Tax=Vibrio nitrifigilis TaxID=2789781 RepID=A0ABS0GIV7_9VIBR|nr:LysR family transcriptional regulator [Vibrio nitrifigilis]MBF9002123.1 LysR family transcriptional regulator [Vibrio nitrifigilis]
MNLDLNQLRILIALDDERNITRAAERLYVSQSAASHNLAKLRERFNDPLFVRTSRGMEPTPFTKSMLPVLRDGMNNIIRASDMQSSFNPQTDAHTFYIGACDYFEFVGMPLLAEAFVERAPNIRLSIDMSSDRVKMKRIEKGRLDLYVGINKLEIASKNFNCWEWLSEQYVAVVPLWRKLPEKLSTIEFAKENQVHLPITENASDVIDSWLYEQNLYRNIQMVTQSYAIGGMISAKTGLLFPVPIRVAELLTEMIPLKIVELPDGIPPVTLSIITHKLYDHQESIQWLLSEINALK